MAALSVTRAGWIYALAYLVGAAAFYAMARRRRLATEGIGMVAVAGLLGGLIGANLFQFVATGGAPGKSVLGGVLGGFLSVALVKRRLGLRRPTGDLFAVALSAGEAVGRWGCFVGGCCYGKTCALPWAVWQHGAWRHPTQLYLAAACTLIFAILVAVELRLRPAENGLFHLQGLLYCPARFTIEFFRDGPPAALGLTAAQWTCLAGFLFFAWRLVSARRLPTPRGMRHHEPRRKSSGSAASPDRAAHGRKAVRRLRRRLGNASIPTIFVEE